MEQKRRGRTLTMRAIQNSMNKEDRILANQGEFERGLCHFDPTEGDQRLLIDQFLDFGQTGVHDDGPDAWDCARRLLPGRRGQQPFFYEGLPRQRRPLRGSFVRNAALADDVLDSSDDPFAM